MNFRAYIIYSKFTDIHMADVIDPMVIAVPETKNTSV